MDFRLLQAGEQWEEFREHLKGESEIRCLHFQLQRWGSSVVMQWDALRPWKWRDGGPEEKPLELRAKMHNTLWCLSHTNCTVRPILNHSL